MISISALVQYKLFLLVSFLSLRFAEHRVDLHGVDCVFEVGPEHSGLLGVCHHLYGMPPDQIPVIIKTSTKNSGPGSLLMQELQKKVYSKGSRQSLVYNECVVVQWLCFLTLKG